MDRIQRTSVSDQVFERLKAEIISKRWPPGSKIPSENELTRMLSVSRISIRAAIQRLTALGLLESRQGEGTFVQEPSAGMYMNPLIPMFFLSNPQLFEVLEYRKIVEAGTIAVAVERATDEDIDHLSQILREMRDNKADIEKFAQADFKFHLAIAEITRNSVVIKVNHVIHDILSESMVNIVRLLGTIDGLNYHSQIVEAFKAKDSTAAQELMAEHVQRTIDRLVDQGLC